MLRLCNCFALDTEQVHQSELNFSAREGLVDVVLGERFIGALRIATMCIKAQGVIRKFKSFGLSNAFLAQFDLRVEKLFDLAAV